ncbi:hypothetical protein B0H14DRAFT_2334881, partial [Mycena olivaceomarginata]
MLPLVSLCSSGVCTLPALPSRPPAPLPSLRRLSTGSSRPTTTCPPSFSGCSHPTSPRLPATCSSLPDREDLDDTPRFDLLDLWVVLLRNQKPEWEVVWQPMSEGRDKRMTIRFRDAGFKKDKGDKSACPALEKAKAALKARGILSTDSYSLANGSYLTLADHCHVDDILSAGVVTVPTLSANPIPVMRCRQIKIENCFELVVSGISEGEGVQSSICRWLARHFRDAVTNESCFVDARVADFERDCLVFHMADWASTTRVLAAGDKIVSEFKPNSPSIHCPQLVLAFNNSGVWRPKSMAQTFQDGASTLDAALNSLRAEVHELKWESRAQHESNQLAISAVSRTVSTLHTNVKSLHAELSQVQMHLAHHQNTLKFGPQEHHAEAKVECERLFKEQKALMQKLSSGAGHAIALLGGTLGSSMPPPITPPGIAAPAAGGRERSRSLSPAPIPASTKKRKSGNEEMDDNSLMTDRPHNTVSPCAPLKAHILIATRDASSVKSMKCSETKRVLSRVYPVRVFHGASLKGRLLAVDVILPTESGRGFVHRMIGIYAPWDPGINTIDPNAREFWTDVTTFCRETRTSWTMSGDFNATVVSSER